MNSGFNIEFNKPFTDLIKLGDYYSHKESFPPTINLEDRDYNLSGYFVSYEHPFQEINLLSEIKEHGFSRLVNSNSEFLLFLQNKQTNQIQVCVDQFISFSCYFSFLKDKVLFSSDFATLKNKLKGDNTKLRANLDGIMTELLWTWNMTEDTLIDQIKMLPAGCLLSINYDNSTNYTIKHLIDVKKILDATDNQTQNLSLSDFAKKWVDTMTEVIRDRVDTLPKGVVIACDLSSGFDCTLVAYCLSKVIGPKGFVCYSSHSSYNPEETNVSTMHEFAARHGLILKDIDVTSAHDYDIQPADLWSLDDVAQTALDRQEVFLDLLSSDSVQIEFTGEGGDEIYGSNKIDLFSYFDIQSLFILNVIILKKYKNELLYTQEGVEKFLSRDRFNKKTSRPTIVSSTGVLSLSKSYPRYDIHRLRLINPFMDTRLISLARNIPVGANVDKWDLKLLLMSELKDIFVDGMFIEEKVGNEITYGNFIKKQKPFIKEVLANSVLEKLGLIDSSYLAKLIEDHSSVIYTDFSLSMAFETLIQVDWFLQKNQIEA